MLRGDHRGGHARVEGGAGGRMRERAHARGGRRRRQDAARRRARRGAGFERVARALRRRGLRPRRVQRQHGEPPSPSRAARAACAARARGRRCSSRRSRRARGRRRRRTVSLSLSFRGTSSARRFRRCAPRARGTPARSWRCVATARWARACACSGTTTTASTAGRSKASTRTRSRTMWSTMTAKPVSVCGSGTSPCARWTPRRTRTRAAARRFFSKARRNRFRGQKNF